ncbi:pentatricopeptide repeat-containing protein At1g59720, chloroplastic/mitochondrial [Beta vulgaris subsp. vulgaris]|uniref:pentatricopeptide repeat-containing protein At1g59720, chloroplastic/mitochondrial n=1 Tax=Beta vulgaris subsp. vulgaris TaxID=3555 RepID=UPI0020373AD6|nr:pentatricopeptide repeat-containing protein At1g59720, chloroplastic/mitochondrial [Beta vulgaris subsp. vulgaris]
MRLYATQRRLFRNITTQSLSSKSQRQRSTQLNCLSLFQNCKSLLHLHQIHAQILKLGLQNNPLVLTKFTSTSSDLHAIDYASSFLFHPGVDTHNYDTFLFNTVIRGYAKTSDLKHCAVNVYCFMVRNGVLPNKFTYPFVLKACAGVGDLRLGKQVHGSVLKLGFEGDLHVGNTVVHMYGCCEDAIEDARKVFDEMPERNSVTWSVMIGVYMRLGLSVYAVELFRQMQVAKVSPDEFTMVAVVSACGDLSDIELGKWAESYIEREQIHKSVELCNSLISMFMKCGDVEKAVSVFRSMKERDIVSWTSVLSGLGMHGHGKEAVSFFEEMKGAGVTPDDTAFISLLNACSHAGLVDQGRFYFKSMMDYGIPPKMKHYGCMVDLLCRAGLVQVALKFVESMPIEPNSIILRTLINACHSQDQVKLNEVFTERLINNEPMHESNYVILSNIYAKLSIWENKYIIRQMMEQKGIKKNPGCTMV